MVVLNPVVQSYLAHKLSERSAHYTAVQQYRSYADGEQTTHLTDDMKILLVGADSSGDPASDPEFVLNICSTILDVECDRLNIQGFDVILPGQEGLSDQLTGLVSDWWNASRMDEGQQNGHYAAGRDGDSFPVVWWDAEHERPCIAVNAAYDGQDNGADVFYVDDDPNQPDSAVKIWSAGDKVRRKNVYYPDRIEYWINDTGLTPAFADAGWRPLRYSDEDWAPTMQEAPSRRDRTVNTAATLEWWTDTGTAQGRPLGLPVFHLRHQARGTAYGRSGITDVVPGLQDAINRAGLDVQAAAILSGFKIVTITGMDLQDTTLKVEPGGIMYVSDPEAAIGQIAESDLMQLIEVKNTFIKDAATLTNTPLSFFNLGGQAPAEGSSKQLELGLLAKTRRNQTSYGNTWEDVVRFMLRLASVMGEVALTWEQIDALQIKCKWQSAEIRNEVELITIADGWSRHGIPREKIWAKLGFDQDEIDQMMVSAQEQEDLKRQQAMGQMAGLLRDMEAARDGINEQADRAGLGAGRNPGTNGRPAAGDRGGVVESRG